MGDVNRDLLMQMILGGGMPNFNPLGLAFSGQQNTPPVGGQQNIPPVGGAGWHSGQGISGSAQPPGMLSRMGSNFSNAGGIDALMGNPMFGMGMGLLASSRTGNPWQGALAGAYGSAQYKQQQREYEIKNKEFEREQKQREDEMRRQQAIKDSATKAYERILSRANEDGVIDEWEQKKLDEMKFVIDSVDGELYADILSRETNYKPMSPIGQAAADFKAGVITQDQFNQIVAGGGSQAGPTTSQRDWAELTRLGGPDWAPGMPYNKAQEQFVTFSKPSFLGYTPNAQFDRSRAEQRIKFVADYPVAVTSASDGINSLLELRKVMETAPTGLGGKILAWTDEELQNANAMLNDATLNKVGLLKSIGINLAPFTAEDVQLVMDTQGSLTNQRDANLTIIDRNIAAYQRIKSDLEGTEEFYRLGGDPVLAPNELHEYLLSRRRRLGLSAESPSGPDDTSYTDLPEQGNNG